MGLNPQTYSLQHSSIHLTIIGCIRPTAKALLCVYLNIRTSHSPFVPSRSAVEPCLSKGSHTCAVPLKLFALNRFRLVEALKQIESVQDNSLVLLQGGSILHLYDTDVEYDVFRQVRENLQQSIRINNKAWTRNSTASSPKDSNKLIRGDLGEGLESYKVLFLSPPDPFRGETLRIRTGLPSSLCSDHCK